MVDLNYEVLNEGPFKVLRINYEKIPEAPSLEDSSFCMEKTIDILFKSGYVNKIVYLQKRLFEYDENTVKLLFEIKDFYIKILSKDSLLNYTNLINYLQNNGTDVNLSKAFISRFFFELQKSTTELLKADPISYYVKLKRMIRELKVKADIVADDNEVLISRLFVRILDQITRNMESILIIKQLKDQIAGLQLGDRSLYGELFRPIIKPEFMYTRLMSYYPKDGVAIDSYHLSDTEITMFEFTDTIKKLYHIIPPESKLSEDEYDLLENGRSILAEHKPTQEEFTDPLKLREIFTRIAKDLLVDLSKYSSIRPSDERFDILAHILVRYTIGFGMVELLLSDEKVQDININSPYGRTPIFIVHQDYGYCETNIFLSTVDVQSFASKLRIISGRPLDEANQILDTELVLPIATARVSVITYPLNPTGLAFSFRRHRNKPWTLQLFVNYKTMNSLAAGLLSFLVDGSRSFMIAGTRSSGKSSILGSLMVEIMRKYRVITIEDTLELPGPQLIDLGYNIQQMKVASSLAKGSTEMAATEGIRATLRLGDSALIIGEVRSDEAISIYEAMRVGAAANVVAGTIHADSPYGVFDRVVNDIGVPKTSFKATDIVLIAAPVKSADGLSSTRRVTRITEIRKDWEDDPLQEHAFVDLMTYDVDTDSLKPTDALLNGDSDILKLIGANVKEFAGNWDAIWNNILLRAELKDYLVKRAQKLNRIDLLEAEFVLKANEQFHLLISSLKRKNPEKDVIEIYKLLEIDWKKWLENELLNLVQN